MRRWRHASRRIGTIGMRAGASSRSPFALAAALQAAACADGLVIVDCLTLWLSNLLEASDTQAATRETRALLAALPALAGDCILISNEVGFGIIPASALARRFGDEAGRVAPAHRQLCATAWSSWWQACR